MKIGEIWITKLNHCNPPYRVKITNIWKNQELEFVAYLLLETDIKEFENCLLDVTNGFISTDFLTMRGATMTRESFLEIFTKCY